PLAVVLAGAPALPTTARNSSFVPTRPWMGTCWATSSFRRWILRLRLTVLGFGVAGGVAPGAGGEYRSALIRIFSAGRYASSMLAACASCVTGYISIVRVPSLNTYFWPTGSKMGVRLNDAQG